MASVYEVCEFFKPHNVLLPGFENKTIEGTRRRNDGYEQK